MDLSTLAEQFERDGYVVVSGFLDAAACQKVNAALDEHFHIEAIAKAPDEEARHGCDVAFWNPISEGHPVFLELMNNCELDRLTRAVLGGDYVTGARHTLVMASLLGGVGQAWHQDSPPDSGRNFNLNRLIYTRDVTPEDGAIFVVPGSHKMGRISGGGDQETIEGELMLTPAAGTLVLLHGHCFHKVTPNQSCRPRISINFRALAAGVPEDICMTGVYRNATVDFRVEQGAKVV